MQNDLQKVIFSLKTLNGVTFPLQIPIIVVKKKNE